MEEFERLPTADELESAYPGIFESPEFFQALVDWSARVEAAFEEIDQQKKEMQ